MNNVTTNRTENDSKPINKYDRVVTICNNLALIVSQCTMDQFVVRLKLLSQLQRCWSMGYCVVLKLESGVALEELIGETWDDDMDMKPDLDAIAPDSIPAINESRSRISNVRNISGKNNRKNNGGNGTNEFEYIANDEDDVYVANDDDCEVDSYAVDHVRDSVKSKKQTSRKPAQPRKDIVPVSSLRHETRVGISRNKSLAVKKVKLDDVADASAVRNDNTLTKGAGEDASCDSIVHCTTCNISTVRHVHCTMCKKTFQALVGLTKHIRQKHNDDITDTSVVQNGDASDDPCTVNQIEEVADFEKTPHDAFEKCATCNVFTLPHVHCVTCNKTFQTHAGLAGHQKRQKHWDDKTDVSLVQNVDAASDAPAMDQRDVVAVEIASRDLHCLACKKLFQTPAALMRHQRRKHFARQRHAFPNYICESCGATFTYRSNFLRHMRDVHKIVMKRRSIEDELMSQTLNNQCLICQKILSNQASLSRHMQDHRLVAEQRESRTLFECKMCGSSFRYRRGLLQHIRYFHSTVSGQKTIRSLIDCNICGSSFLHRQGMLRHKRQFHSQDLDDALAGGEPMMNRDNADVLDILLAEITGTDGPRLDGDDRITQEDISQYIAPHSVQYDRLMQLVPSSDTYTYKMMTYLTDELSTPGSFETTFRVNLSSQEEFGAWLKLFETKNSTQFNIIQSKASKGRRVFFKRFLKCIHSVKGGTIGKGKNTGCPTRMTVTIQKLPKHAAVDMTSPELEVVCDILLVWVHNHPLREADALRRHTVAPEVDEKLVQLLRHGHSIMSALKCIEMEIDDNAAGESVDNECVQTPRSMLPDYQHSHYIYQRRFKNEYGDNAKISGLLKLFENVNEVAGEICVAYEEFQGSNLIAICMPFMKRVHQQLPESGEIVYLESSGEMHKGKSGYYVFLLMTHSKAGALPLAVGITPSESVEHLTQLFNLIKTVIPTDSFYDHGSFNGPELFMTDDNVAERTALFNVWPASRPMLCQFRLLQSQWRWLLSNQNFVDQRDRPALFAWVKKLVYAPTEIESRVQFERFQYDPLVVKYDSFRDQIIGLFMRREEWSTALLPSELPRVTHANSYVETSMRALKDQIFEQTRAFKLLQMVHFVTVQFPAYYERRLEDFSSNRVCRPPAKYPKFEGQAIIEVSDDIYEISSSKDMNLTYTVNTATTICTCNEWEAGKMCKHLHYVFTRRKMSTISNNANDFKGVLYGAASGNPVS